MKHFSQVKLSKCFTLRNHKSQQKISIKMRWNGVKMSSTLWMNIYIKLCWKVMHYCLERKRKETRATIINLVLVVFHALTFWIGFRTIQSFDFIMMNNTAKMATNNLLIDRKLHSMWFWEVSSEKQWRKSNDCSSSTSFNGDFLIRVLYHHHCWVLRLPIQISVTRRVIQRKMR